MADLTLVIKLTESRQPTVMQTAGSRRTQWSSCRQRSLRQPFVPSKNRHSAFRPQRPNFLVDERRFWCHYCRACTSLGEASARIQATDLERRETPRVMTAPSGLRVEPKWLPGQPDTPCSVKALTRGVPRPVDRPGRLIPLCTVLAPLCALAVRR